MRAQHLPAQVLVTKNPTQEQSWEARSIPDSDNSAFLGLGAGDGDSLFSALLCLGATRQNKPAQRLFNPYKTCRSFQRVSQDGALTWSPAGRDRAAALTGAVGLLGGGRAARLGRGAAGGRGPVAAPGRAGGGGQAASFAGRAGHGSLGRLLWWRAGTRRGGGGAAAGQRGRGASSPAKQSSHQVLVGHAGGYLSTKNKELRLFASTDTEPQTTALPKHGGQPATLGLEKRRITTNLSQLFLNYNSELKIVSVTFTGFLSIYRLQLSFAPGNN